MPFCFLTPLGAAAVACSPMACHMSASHSDCRHAIHGDRVSVAGTRYTTLKHRQFHSRQRDHNEVQPIPGVSEIRELRQNETASQDLDDSFHCVDPRERLPWKQHKMHKCSHFNSCFILCIITGKS